jgi:hypothetical protein
VVARVLITRTNQARRASSDLLQVELKIATRDLDAASRLRDSLKAEAINIQLTNQELPPCQLVSATVVKADSGSVFVTAAPSEPSVWAASPWPAVGIALGTAIVLMFGAFLLFGLLRKGESDEDRLLRLTMERLRGRFRITHADGYIVGAASRLSWSSHRDCTVIQRSHLEAAARLALLQDFDVNQFDALCLCLECGGPAPLERWTRPYRAVGDWLVELSTLLIRPVVPSAIGGDGKDALGESLGSPLGVEQRFPYFVHKVAKARIWSDDDGALFTRLQDGAALIMETVAGICDRRFEELCSEPGGRELVAFCASPADMPALIGINRQDHLQVCAVDVISSRSCCCVCCASGPFR